MTSNQLTYWKNQEEIRANKAREAENIRHNIQTEQVNAGSLNEQVRHNKEQETIANVQNQLREQGLQVDRAANLAKIQELYGKYGAMALNQMPNTMQAELANALGLESNQFNDVDADSMISDVWEEIKSVWSTFWGGISKLF